MIEVLPDYITVAPNSFAVTRRDDQTPRHDPINDLIGAVTKSAWQTLNQPSISGSLLNRNPTCASKRRNRPAPRYVLVTDDSREVKQAAEWIRAVTDNHDLLRIVKYIFNRRAEILGRLRRELAEDGVEAFLARHGRRHNTQATVWSFSIEPVTPERARQIARRKGRGLIDDFEIIEEDES